MKKKFLLFLLLASTKFVFCQCEYYDDPNALRVNGTGSAPTCSGNFTYCSKNGSGISPYGNYRVLNLIFIPKF